MNPFKLKIANHEITIDSRFTIVLGKFKKNLLRMENINNVIKIIENINNFPIELIIDIFKDKNTNYEGLQRTKNFLNTISNYKAIVESGVMEFSDFTKIVESFHQIIKYISLTNEKKILTKELEISRLFNQSSELSAIKDLITKLRFSIKQNKQKLGYFEEDFQNTKTQTYQAINNIERISKKIEDLTQFKKDYFNQINKITRNMEKDQEETNLETLRKLGIDLNLTNSEKIRMLQKKAQEAQFEVKQLEKALNEAKSNYELIRPKYESYVKDYRSMIQEVENDEYKLNELNNELERKLKNNEKYNLDDLNQKEMQFLRPIGIIETEYRTIQKEIPNLSLLTPLYNPDEPMNLNLFIDELENLNHNVTDNENKYIIKLGKNNIEEYMNGLRKLDSLIYNMEMIYNKFLAEINIQSHFHLLINDVEQKFSIRTILIRKINEEINWNDLTTPERVYCGITLFITIKILLNSNPIIFSNLFLPITFNKRGSILRTVNKLIPLFEHNEKLKDMNLIFVLSNLEMKKEIENIKVINVKES